MSEMKQRKQYTKEFKIQALDLARQLGSFTEAAKQLGIDPPRLHYWKKQYKIVNSIESQSAAQLVAEAEEIKQLKKKVKELESANYILKRAAAFFCQDQLK